MKTSLTAGGPVGSAPPKVVGEIESFLQEMIAALTPAPLAPGPGRPRILPALALWAGLLVCVLRGFTSQLDLWRLLTLSQLWFYPRFPVTDQASFLKLAMLAGYALLLFGFISRRCERHACGLRSTTSRASSPDAASSTV